jgi:hypothetical protein
VRDKYVSMYFCYYSLENNAHNQKYALVFGPTSHLCVCRVCLRLSVYAYVYCACVSWNRIHEYQHLSSRLSQKTLMN